MSSRPEDTAPIRSPPEPPSSFSSFPFSPPSLSPRVPEFSVGLPAANLSLHFVAETIDLALPPAAHSARGRWWLTGERVRSRLGWLLLEPHGRRDLLAAAVRRSSPRRSPRQQQRKNDDSNRCLDHESLSVCLRASQVA